MSIFTKIGSAVKSAVSSVGKTVKNAFSGISGKSQVAGVGAMQFPIGQNVPSNANKEASSYPGFNAPTGSTKLSYININPGGGVGNVPYGPNLPSNGPQLPVQINAGQQKKSSVSGSSASATLGADFASYGAYSQPERTISTRSTLSSSPSSTGVSPTQPLVLNSQPTVTNVNSVDNTKLVTPLSGYKKYNATSNQWEDVEDPYAETDADIKKKTRDLYDELVGPRQDVNNDSEVIAAKENRRKIQEALLAPTSELNAIIAKQKQDLLQLRMTGAQEGVTEAVYGNQENTINYNAAIRALPLQASIANLRGQFEVAQDYLNELVQTKTAQINGQYEYNKNLFSAIEGAISKKDQRVYNEMVAKNERDAKYAIDLEKAKAKIIESAFKNNAPHTVIQRISDATDLISAQKAAGNYGVDKKESQTFTSTQLNKGSYNAGVPLQTFVGLDEEVKNYFVNAPSQQLENIKSAINSVKNGSEKAADVKEEIDSSLTLPDSVKTYLKNNIDAVASTTTPKQSAFGKAWDFIKGLF